MHTSPSLNASRRTAWIAGTSAALGLYGLHVATQDSMRLDGAAVSERECLTRTQIWDRTVDNRHYSAPTSIPPTIDAKVAEVASVSVEPTASEPASTVTDAAETTSAEETAPAAEPTEEEDPKSAAFDPVTGEINWDCPCLGGMAHGPCGEEFRAAFSCFVYSEGEPKGIDCVEKFKGMQDCFRAHPDVYGEGSSSEYYQYISIAHSYGSYCRNCG